MITVTISIDEAQAAQLQAAADAWGQRLPDFVAVAALKQAESIDQEEPDPANVERAKAFLRWAEGHRGRNLPAIDEKYLHRASLYEREQ